MVRTKFTKWLNLLSWPQDGRVRLWSCRIPPQRGAVEADRDKCPGWGQDTAFPTCAGEPLNYGVPYLHSHLVSRRSVKRRHRVVVQAQVDAQLRAVMNAVVHNRAPQNGDAGGA